VEYRKIGKSELKASAVSLGTDTFGVSVDEKSAGELVEHALSLGINYLDTADVYGHSLSEQFVGKAIKGKRNQFIIATKFGASLANDGRDFTLIEGKGKGEYIKQAIEASLQRLGTDYIDLYQFHMPDASTDIEETLRALDELVKAGKIRYAGCSNLAAWELIESLWVSRTSGLVSFVSIQSKYNLLDRRIEEEVVPCCQAYNVSVIPWFPLAGGFLTGKHRRGQPFLPGTRFAAKPAFYSRIATDDSYDLLDKLETFARERGHTMAELAIAWLTSQPFIATVIAGVTKKEQISANAAAADWELSGKDKTDLDKVMGYRPYMFSPAEPRKWGTPEGYRLGGGVSSWE
jgi:aryl-alcohol dehydrogenase-like predicted oxidoreductase